MVTVLNNAEVESLLDMGTCLAFIGDVRSRPVIH